MTAEEAMAGLVLCACELLRASRGAAAAYEEAEAETAGGFSEERFLELSGRTAGGVASEREPETGVKSASAALDSLPEPLPERERADREFLELLRVESEARKARARKAGNAPEGLSPERFSEYLERDSRRYDGGFARY